MKYDIKAIINGAEIMDKAEPGKPSITGVALMNSVSGGALEIGSVAIDKLTLTLINPYKASYDGDTVELWVAPDEDGAGIDRIGELEELIGDETEEESIDDADIDVSVDEAEEEGEDMSEEELAESEVEEAILREKIVEQVDGESLEAEEVTTDEAAEEAWKKVGTFFVYSQKSTSEGLQLVCFDSTIFLHGVYTPAKATDTVQNHFDSFRTACQTETGVAVESFTFDGVYNKEITWNFSCSYRDALGYFAGLAGGFAHSDENGEIGISFYMMDDTVLLKEELLAYREESSGEIVIDGISCNRSRTTNLTSDVIEMGAGQAISWTNPFIDENILNGIFEEYKGMRYIGAAVSCTWDLALQAGDLIRIMSEAEYGNWIRMRNAAEAAADDSSIRAEMATQGKVVLIGTQTIQFAGEAITNIKSTREAETAKENEMTSPWKKSAMELADETAKAQSTANAAQTKAEKTEKHFWTDQDGAHVTATEKGETISGGNTLITETGIEMRDGDTLMASFGADGAQIGKNGNNARMMIGATKLLMNDANQVECFKIEMPERNETSTETRFSLREDYRKKTGENLSTKGPFIWKCELPYTPVAVKNSYYTIGNLGTIYPITQDASQSIYYTLEENELTVIVTSSYSGGSISNVIFLFDAGATLYTTTIGSYPASGRDDYMALVIGNGKSGENCDAFTVDWNGKVVAGDGIYAGGNSHVEGNLTARGKVYDGERCLSDIGTVYRAEKDVAITTDSINTKVKGATITVPAGIYVVCGEWIFDTSSTTGARNLNLEINVGENMEARSRVYANAKNYASLHVSTIVLLDATTELSVRGSSSEKSPAERTRIRAVRIK